MIILSTDKLMMVGDSIANGYGASNAGDNNLGGFIPYFKTAVGITVDSVNKGLLMASTTNIANNISTYISDNSPDLIAIHVGTNDPTLGITLSTTMANFASIITTCKNASKKILINQILPRPTTTEEVKIINARLEDLCVEQSVDMAPVWDDAQNPVALDDLNPAYASDTVHLNNAGYEFIGGSLMPYFAVPDRSRIWGSINFLIFGIISWKWWLLNGTSSIVGDADSGTLNVPQNQTADSNVLSFYPNGKAVEISYNVTAGSPTIYYRTSNNNFARNAATSWTEYTGVFASSALFIQIRVGNTGAATVEMSDITLDWSQVFTTTTTTTPAPLSKNNRIGVDKNEVVLKQFGMARLPNWTTANRPTLGSYPAWGYNITDNKLDIWDGSQWKQKSFDL